MKLLTNEEKHNRFFYQFDHIELKGVMKIKKYLEHSVKSQVALPIFFKILNCMGSTDSVMIDLPNTFSLNQSVRDSVGA